MIADRHAHELERAVLLDGRDRREIGGPAAHVDDEDHVARLELLAPAVAHRLEPRVERGLRLLEQHCVIEARGPRGLHGELARRGIERRGHGEDDVLLGELQPLFLELLIEDLPEVLEVAPRRLHGRDLLHVLRRADGQDAHVPVHAAVREPALRARHEPRGRLHPAGARVLPDDERAIRVPRQGLRPLALVREIQERGQELPRLDRARRHELRHPQHLRPRALHVRPHEREGRVGRPEIDADRDLRACAHSSTSAGATTLAS